MTHRISFWIDTHLITLSKNWWFSALLSGGFGDKLIINLSVLNLVSLKNWENCYLELLINLQEIAAVRLFLFPCLFCMLHYYLSTPNGIYHQGSKLCTLFSQSADFVEYLFLNIIFVCECVSSLKKLKKSVNRKTEDWW